MPSGGRRRASPPPAAAASRALRFGVLPQVLPVMLAQALYFFESNTRSAAILGVVGAGGIGLQIAERIRVRHWDEVAFIILLMVVTVGGDRLPLGPAAAAADGRGLRAGLRAVTTARRSC